MAAMRDIALVTVARSDWGIYRSVAKELAKTPGIALRVLASGMHLNERFGLTIRLVEEEAAALGVPVERVAMKLASDAPADIAAAMGAGLQGFGHSFEARRPDILLVLGDRFEMFSAVAAATPFVLPVFHIHGGERTAGAIDDALRHAMTKMSHVHFVSTRDYGRRVRQLGEDAWRIVVSGAPALDDVRTLSGIDAATLTSRLGVDVSKPYILMAYHPTTLEPGSAAEEGRAVLDALTATGLPVAIMMPNADPGGLVLRDLIESACAQHPSWRTVENLSFQVYLNTMRRAAAFVGNSSSGIIEAPSLGVPVVNIGRRQEGRVRGANVVDVAPDRDSIVNGIRLTQDPLWRSRHLTGVNPYDAGGAAQTIARTIAEIPLDSRLCNKGFVDVPVARRPRPPSEFTVAKDACLRDVVACINDNRAGIAVVVDGLGVPVDVVTDGDVRRALLAGATLESPVRFLQVRRRTAPRLGSIGGSEQDWISAMKDGQVRQLPLLDDVGRVVDLVLLDELSETVS